MMHSFLPRLSPCKDLYNWNLSIFHGLNNVWVGRVWRHAPSPLPIPWTSQVPSNPTLKYKSQLFMSSEEMGLLVPPVLRSEKCFEIFTRQTSPIKIHQNITFFLPPAAPKTRYLKTLYVLSLTQHLSGVQFFPTWFADASRRTSRYLLTITGGFRIYLGLLYATRQEYSPVGLEDLLLPCSAISISRRPNSACLMFFTQKLLLPLELVCCFSRGDTSSSELSV